MGRGDILLYFIYLPVRDPNILSPIQIMKGMFLLKMELDLKNFYEFKPYLYGPCSFEIYRDLNMLLKDGLIASIPSISGWRYYRITSLGIEKCEDMSIDNRIVDKMIEIKNKIMSMSFIELLKYVYNLYPEYAKKSIINVWVLE